MNCNMYKPDINWVVIEVVKILILSVEIGLIFYDSLLGVLVTIPAWFYIWKRDIYVHEDNCKRKIRAEFKDCLLQVSGNLNAGYSLENAFVQITKDKNISESVYMLPELKRIAIGLSCNRRIEDMLMEFGEKTCIEEIREVANLIVMAKVHGGNIIHLIRQAAANLSERQSVELEISTMVAAKKLEGSIMVLMPFVIVIFMRLTNPSYMAILYESFLGHVLMTVCLILVLVSWIVINKIMKLS